MHFDSNTTRIRRSIYVRVAQLCFDGELLERIDRVPYDMRPKDSSHQRCCVHKERAVIKYRLMAMLGFGVEDEVDEMIPLSEYAEGAMKREIPNQPLLTIIDDACNDCVKTQYFITNACRGCYARPCMVNCPKKCISFNEGQAHINVDECANCGKCMQVCPYHAVLRVPVTCEEECPVGAISKQNGKETINESKCISCGRCIAACPFGAIMDRSEIVDVIKHLKTNRKMVALIAPSIVGQFNASMENIVGSLKQMGFDVVAEVAYGAGVVAQREAAELVERLKGGAPFMTTSCCSSYLQAVSKHVKSMKPYVSHTCTPMHYTAEIAAQQYPDAIRVFIGPCISKKREAADDPLVDYTLTFEEIGCMFVAKGISVEETEPVTADIPAQGVGLGFPVSGGVASAVREMLDQTEGEPIDLRPELVDGITKKSMRSLSAYAKKGGDFNFLEVMACEGGCVNGSCTISSSKSAARKVAERRQV